MRQARLNRGSGEEDGVEADHCEVREVPSGEFSSSRLASIWRLERTGLELLSTDADLNGDKLSLSRDMRQHAMCT